MKVNVELVPSVEQEYTTIRTVKITDVVETAKKMLENNSITLPVTKNENSYICELCW